MRAHPVTTALLCCVAVNIMGCSQRCGDAGVGRADARGNGATHDLRTTIERILAEQADAWNRGDIDGFMSHYWHSDELTFSSDGRTRRGWDQTRARYEQRYPTPERMGHLRFSDIAVRPLGDDAALVLGTWHLTREPDSVGGNFSLVFARIDGQWKIIHDHTSTTPSD